MPCFRDYGQNVRRTINGGRAMKAFPIFMENSPLYQMLAAGPFVQDRRSSGENQQLLRMRKKHRLDTELRQAKKKINKPLGVL